MSSSLSALFLTLPMQIFLPALSLLVTYLLLPRFHDLAHANGLVDVPGGHRHHDTETPLVGGLVMDAVSALLRQHDIEPYIWMQAGLTSLFRKLRDEEGGLGVLGIACVPELVRGMRMCHKLDVPAVGIPLNANRCARWMGAFHPTSVELDRVASLVSAGLAGD